MMPGFDIGFFTMFTAVILVITIPALVIADIVMMVQLPRRKVPAGMALWIAAAGVFPAEAYLLMRLSAHDLFEPGIAVFFFVPVVTGLIVLVMAAMQEPSARNRVLVILAIPPIIPIGMMWRELVQRNALYSAVLREDSARAGQLLRVGVARGKDDFAFRQAQLVHAARNVNPDIVTALLEAGADPNSPSEGRYPLLAAITSDAVLRYPRIDPETHPKRRFLTVKALLDHGANPNAPRDRTPSETAWYMGLQDIVDLLKQKGARDADTLAATFEELLRASAEGDVPRVRALVAQSVAAHRQDLHGRAPLVEAARNGHTEVVDILLQNYGASVQCSLVSDARSAAKKANHAQTVARLRELCFE